MKHGRCIGGPLRAHLVFEVALAATEGCFPLIPCPNSKLVIGIAQIYLCEDFGAMQAVQHLRYEGKGVSVIDRDLVESPVVDY